MEDVINGCFETLGGVVIAKNCLQLYRDKELKGVSLLPMIFFNLWGVWNLYFYPQMGAWWSFLGAIGIVVANSVWVCQAIYYRRLRGRVHDGTA
jgi:uncharacterized membrane protein YfcA